MEVADFWQAFAANALANLQSCKFGCLGFGDCVSACKFDALHMVGTLEKDGQLYALIKTPDGALHRVKKGNYMGQNYGVVVGINDTAVELKEMVQDAAGDWIESKATVALQE